MHKIKSPARMRQGRHALETPVSRFEATRLSSKDSGTAPLRISRKRHTASGGLPGHESVSVPSDAAVGTAFKTSCTAGIQGFKTTKARLKSSKDYPYYHSLRTAAADTGVQQSSKDAIGASQTSKDFGGACL